ncbi:hypothetical protein EEB14_09195 [Rhodococcus sp. WS4]|nr:hypothetical protein EEB14_09195 [Rhodococcus sp. WS4]
MSVLTEGYSCVHEQRARAESRRDRLTPVHGAFNLAAEPPVDGDFLAQFLGARRVRIAPAIARSALAAGWHLHAVPASPGLFETVLRVPLMDCSRARSELQWAPRHEFTTGIGQRA